MEYPSNKIETESNHISRSSCKFLGNMEQSSVNQYHGDSNVNQIHDVRDPKHNNSVSSSV